MSLISRLIDERVLRLVDAVVDALKSANRASTATALEGGILAGSRMP